MSISKNRNYEQLKNSLNIELIVKKLLPKGKGSPEWISKNPTRNDSKAGSFKVNLISGLWIDFATNDKGDIFHLYSYLNGCSVEQAYDELDNNQIINPKLQKKEKKDKIPTLLEDNDYTIILPVPDDAGEPITADRDGYWCYRDKNGDVLMYVSRHNFPDKKVFFPYTYRQKKTGCAYWENKGFGNLPWPLYNLHVLENFPDANVLLVEGEGTADAADRILKDWVCMTWHGGSNAVNRTDIDALRNRNIWIWPDNDDPGFSAMEKLKLKLKDIAASVHCIDLKNLKLIKGWDLKDGEKEGITKEDCMELINKAKQEFVPLNPAILPDLSSNSRPLNTTDNISGVLNHFKVNVKYNLMTNYPEFYASGKNFSTVNEADCYFTEISNLCVKSSVPKVDLSSHLLLIADKNRYHPAIDFITSKSWDGINRIDKLIATVEADNQDLSNKLIYRWLIGCVAAAFSDKGVSLEGALIFQGKQKIGKSYWFIKLLPEKYRNLMKYGESLNTANKDDVMNVTQSWLCELAEFEGTFKKSDVEALKAFITRDHDNYRVPFGKRIRSVPRRTSLFGSVNSSHYLSDDTGNRRYWTVSVKKINYDHSIDMQQVWAELKVLFDNGESYRLTDDEQDLLNNENERFKHTDPLEEQIINRFRWDEDYRNNPLTASEVLNLLGFSLFDANINKRARECGAILSRLTDKRGRKCNGRFIFDLPRERLSPNKG